jgi:hypothetical protein
MTTSIPAATPLSLTISGLSQARLQEPTQIGVANSPR